MRACDLPDASSSRAPFEASIQRVKSESDVVLGFPSRSTFATSTFVRIRAALGPNSTQVLGPSTVFIKVRAAAAVRLVVSWPSAEAIMGTWISVVHQKSAAPSERRALARQRAECIRVSAL